MKVYGIKNCDTVKKALKWLDDNRLTYEFHDYKKSGVAPDQLEEWSKIIGWETLINKKGTTWKKLEPEVQLKIVSKEQAFELMQQKTSVIRRPLIEHKGKITLGFDADAYRSFLL